VGRVGADDDGAIAQVGAAQGRGRGHARSGGKPGSTTSFTSALADIVEALERDPAAPFRPAAARQAGWVALELIEST